MNSGQKKNLKNKIFNLVKKYFVLVDQQLLDPTVNTMNLILTI